MSRKRKIIAITYANELFTKAAKLNKRRAIKVGGADEAIIYTPDDIDSDFKQKNIEILSQEKGNGYWLWKPYFIYKTLNSMDEGDILFYTDAASVCIDSIGKLVDAMEKENQKQMIFSLGTVRIESEYTKRDAFILMSCDEEEICKTPQADGAAILLVNNSRNREFCRKYLEYSQDKRILTDIENVMGKKNYPDFKMHRHDQAVLSLLAKREGFLFFRDPSQYGVSSIYDESVLKRSDYPQILNHHRLAKANNYLYIKIRQLEIVLMIEYKLYLWQKNRKI